MSLMPETSPAFDESVTARLLAVRHDLARAAKYETSRNAFLHTWLAGVLAATQATFGAVFEATLGGFHSIGSLGTAITEREPDAPTAARDDMRRRVIETREPIWVRESDAISADQGPAGGWMTFVAPIGEKETSSGVVEITVDVNTPPNRQRGCANFVVQSITFIDDFLLRERVRALVRAHDLSDELHRVTATIHADTNLDATAFAIANEGRRLVGCDRVTLLRRQQGRYRAVVVSGQDLFDIRSPAIKKLADLATAAAATGELFSSDAIVEAPAPLERALADYLDETHVKYVAVMPLIPKRSECEDRVQEVNVEPIGLLVFEQLAAAELPDDFRQRVAVFADLAVTAYGNALEQERIPLYRTLKKLGRLKGNLFGPSGRFKTLAVGLVIAGFLATLILLPADFSLHAHGTFQPVERRNVFAPLDGTVTELYVRNGERIAAGDPLLELRNTDLEVAVTEVRGDRVSSVEQLASVERALFGEGERLTAEERVRLSGQRAELRQKITALDEKLRLLERKRARLKITSPIVGEIITWNLERLLHDRPVVQGQTLLTVADVAREWELEVYLPERYVGHLSRAQRDSQAPLPVRFRPTSDPSREFVGTIKDIDAVAEVRGDHGNTVLVTVVVDATQLPPLKPGLEATAKVVCGRRSLGYVWLHDLIDFVEAKVLFRLY
jgi:multidrug efflux pump subunit AcrA (membrane-fusion protein)